MFRKNAILVLSLISAGLAVSTARAEDCSRIRLDETVRLANGRTVEGSMVHVVVRNQRQIGSCYAHAAAQIYDAWRFKHGENHPDDYENFSSGFEIGQRFKIDENAKLEANSRLRKKIDLSIDGGYVDRILPFLLEEGTCSQSELNGIFEPSRNLDVDMYASEIMRRFTAFRADFLKARDMIRQKYGIVETPPPPPSAEFPHFRPEPRDNTRLAYPSAAAFHPKAALKEIEVEQEKFLRAALAEIRETHRVILTNKAIYKSINYRVLAELARGWGSREVNTVKLFEFISTIDCAPGRRRKAAGEFSVVNTIPRPNVFTFPKAWRQYASPTMRATIDAELDKGHAKAYPIGIGYCSSIFKEGRAFKAKSWSAKECGLHASLVIGRRPNPKTGSCQYLIRNSWGQECSPYHSDWECDKENGSVWIDADTLERATRDLQTLRTIRD